MSFVVLLGTGWLQAQYAASGMEWYGVVVLLVTSLYCGIVDRDSMAIASNHREDMQMVGFGSDFREEKECTLSVQLYLILYTQPISSYSSIAGFVMYFVSQGLLEPGQLHADIVARGPSQKMQGNIIGCVHDVNVQIYRLTTQDRLTIF
jgi:hypothetical protein